MIIILGKWSDKYDFWHKSMGSCNRNIIASISQMFLLKS